MNDPGSKEGAVPAYEAVLPAYEAVLPAYDVVVLAGGAARRLDGADKPGLLFGGRSSLDRVLDAVPAAASVAVVGPARPTLRPVTWCQEEPPGAGPVAALQVGLAVGAAPLVAVLAADVPLLNAATVDALRAAATRDRPPSETSCNGAVLVDAGGREQPLIAVYARGPLRAAVTPLPPDAPLRRVMDGLRLVRVPDERGVSLDTDTWDQVGRLREHPWTTY